MYISDNFKLSNNLFIKFVPKLVLINSILALLALICYLLDISILPTILCYGDSDNEDSNSGNTYEIATNNNKNNEESGIKEIAKITTNKDDTRASAVEYYNFKIKKETIDNIMDKGKNLAMDVVTEPMGLGPDLGIGAAVGKVAAEAFKQTGGMAPAPRIALIGSTALATAAATKFGLGLGQAFIKNKKNFRWNKYLLFFSIIFS